MTILLSALDKKASTLLCDQLREKITLQISQGILTPGMRLPSCRKLAKQLGISNNTVVNAYQSLISNGMVESRPRSGYFVHHQLPQVRYSTDSQSGQPTSSSTSHLFEKLQPSILPALGPTVQRPDNWADYPYPFVCNQVDTARFPLAEWRTCCYQILNNNLLTLINSDQLYNDSTELVEQIRTRLLPRRGIMASEQEILVTAGAQNAIFITSMLLGPKHKIAVENPCYPDARNIFDQFFEEVRSVPLDDEGLIVDQKLAGCHLAYITPNHQYPTSVRMPMHRRRELLDYASQHNLIIIEDDYDCETDFDPQNEPALKSLQGGENVIYVGSLSKSHSPGLRVGYMVASPDLIKEARALRGMMIRHLPPYMQMATAHFIRQGQYDALIARLQRFYKNRWKVANKALRHYFPDVDIANSWGGTNFLITAKPDVDLSEFENQALSEGIVIDNIKNCYRNPQDGYNKFRLGVSAIGVKKIPQGIKLLRDVFEKFNR